MHGVVPAKWSRVSRLVRAADEDVPLYVATAVVGLMRTVWMVANALVERMKGRLFRTSHGWLLGLSVDG